MTLIEAVTRACTKTSGPAPKRIRRRKRIVTLYFNGLGIRKISKTLKYTDVAAIYRIVKKAGILRSRSEGCRRHLESIKIPLEQLLVSDCTTSRHVIKRRLIEEGRLKNKCVLCGLGTKWREKPLVLVLDHINGIQDDYRFINLRFLCPNCDSQTDTFKGRNKKRKHHQGA